MRAGGRFCVLALCVAGLLLLLPALVDKPAAKQDPPAPPKPPVAAFLKLSGPADVQPGEQGAPQRLERPRGTAVSSRREPTLSEVWADQNGNPLCGGSYIHSVYRAFRLWERSG